MRRDGFALNDADLFLNGEGGSMYIDLIGKPCVAIFSSISCHVDGTCPEHLNLTTRLFYGGK